MGEVEESRGSISLVAVVVVLCVESTDRLAVPPTQTAGARAVLSAWDTPGATTLQTPGGGTSNQPLYHGLNQPPPAQARPGP